MSISREEIIHIAQLADLNLTEGEIEKYTKDMKQILEFADQINKVNTDNVKETVGINNRYNVFRKDEIVEFEDKKSLLQNAPEMEEGMFKIPKVVG